MRKQLLIAAIPVLALAACGDSADTDEADAVDPLAELAAGTGPYLVTYADGSMSLSYAAHDGTEWGGPIDAVEGSEPVRWSTIDGQVCIDFPDAAEDATDFCIENGPLQGDGTWTVHNPNNPDEEPATMRRLDATVESEADMVAAGSYWVDMPNGDSALVVWSDDGVSYLAMNPARSTWRADGNQRCTTPADGEEVCGAPTSELREDNSFTADNNGEAITVRML